MRTRVGPESLVPAPPRQEQGRAGPSCARAPARLAVAGKGRRHFRLRAAFTSFCGALTTLPSPPPGSRGPNPAAPPNLRAVRECAHPSARPPVHRFRGSASVPRRCWAAGRPMLGLRIPGLDSGSRGRGRRKQHRRQQERARSRTGTRTPGRTCALWRVRAGCAGAQSATLRLRPRWSQSSSAAGKLPSFRGTLPTKGGAPIDERWKRLEFWAEPVDTKRKPQPLSRGKA